MKTEIKIIELLKENTGKHMLDSGGTNGRSWQRNQLRDFEKESDLILCEDYPLKNIYHFLKEHLDITEDSEKLQKEYTKMFKDSDDSYMTDMEAFTEHLATEDRSTDDNYLVTKEPTVHNTCNFENLLSQDLQYSIFSLDGNSYFILLQIHNGADIRGGYTVPYIFEVDAEQFLMDMRDLYITTKKGNQYGTDDACTFTNTEGDEIAWEDIFKEGI